ncbi:DUF502 domain-containing protein [Robertmurraya korlensis]|uniref:DUF502 domain-containing protein n=1 Tax=Robertmurraya korlensis TaxID=519977 RepID=UPI00203B3CF6|nr:DUF502 domain-containing protein [Robertmurraya korlensis]MCM3599900.1 DUF502 domain-containing protein [Robertmurraya korlensis]
MKSILKSFVNGILTIVPIILVIYVTYKTFMFLDGLLGGFLKQYFKESYVPGIGILATLVLITILGYLSTKFVTGTIFRIIDRLLEKIPFVKTVYSVIKDTVHSFLGEKKSFSKVALVTVPGTNMKSLGFVTAEDLQVFYEPLSDFIAVYVPQTFQVAGFTFLIKKEDVEFIDVKPEDAMKFILSGGMTSKKTTLIEAQKER